MPTRVTICKGCCCGNVEKGNSEVPIDFLKESWKENDKPKPINFYGKSKLEDEALYNGTVLVRFLSPITTPAACVAIFLFKPSN